MNCHIMTLEREGTVYVDMYQGIYIQTTLIIFRDRLFFFIYMRKRPFPKFIWKMSGMIFFFVGLCGRMRGEGWLVVGNHCLFLKSVTDGAALFYGCLMILCGVNCWPVCEFCFSLGEQMVSSANERRVNVAHKG